MGYELDRATMEAGRNVAEDAYFEAITGEEDMTDSERLDYLDWLLARKEFQNSRRQEEPVSSDMHFMYGECVLYVRTLTGRVAASGSGGTVRDAIDECMAMLSQLPKDKP